MGRALYMAATAASLLLCVGVCGLWVRSYRVADAWNWWGRGLSDRLESSSGQISLWQARLPPEWPVMPGYEPKGVRYERNAPGPSGQNDFSYGFMPGVRRHWRFLGFRWMVCEGGHGIMPAQGRRPAFAFTTAPNWDITVPHWFPALLLSLAPARRLARRCRLRRRARRGQCLACGYDLRASPGRCPECGRLAPTSQAAAQSRPIDSDGGTSPTA
jgi:hypothetical protein